MSDEQFDFDIIIIGGGPSGHQAAITAARAGRSALVVEQEVDVGGACVSNGTIPSKTLRETVAAMRQFGAKTANRFPLHIESDLQVESLMTRKEEVIVAHQKNGAAARAWPGSSASMAAPALSISSACKSTSLGGKRDFYSAEKLIIASGSRPRDPPGNGGGSPAYPWIPKASFP